MKQNKTMGCIAITIVAIIYGVSYMARNMITETKAMNSAVITLLQLAIMGVLFLIYNLATKKNMKIAKKDLPMLILSGLFGTFLFHTLTNLSVEHMGGGVASLLFGLAAAFSLIISAVFFHKKTNALSWIAVLVGLVGLYVIMDITPENLADTDVIGYVFSIGSVLAWVIYCFLAEKVSGNYENSVVLFWNAVVGIVACLPFLFIYPVDGAALSANMSTIIIALVILGVFNATIAYFLNIYAIKQIGVNMANIFLNFMPIATLVALFIVYGEVPSINQVIGGIIIIASVFLLSFAEKKLEAKAK